MKVVEEKYKEKMKVFAKKLANYEDAMKVNTSFKTHKKEREEEDLDRVNVNLNLLILV